MPLLTTADGSHTFLSERYGASYHSRFGAVTESAHVFIDAGLRFKATGQREIAIFEAGFGTGLNTFMSWLAAERHDWEIHYLALEAYPLPSAEVRLLNYPQALGVPERAGDFRQLHTCAWNEPVTLSEYFHFEKRLGRLETMTWPEAAFDLVYFDAFDPQIQPELWTAEILAGLYRALRPEGVLVTYCAQGQFRRTLRGVGFTVERLAGALGKWEMTRARR